MLLFDHPLDICALHKRFFDDARTRNLGAFASFIGIVRSERNEEGALVDGLSFDICQPLLQEWLNGFRTRENEQLKIYFAHARGDVMAGESSYFAAVASRKRRAALELLDEFVEDFKHHAPIWKYDLHEGARTWAKARSFSLPHAGLLAR